MHRKVTDLGGIPGDVRGRYAGILHSAHSALLALLRRLHCAALAPLPPFRGEYPAGEVKVGIRLIVLGKWLMYAACLLGRRR